ncbi:MAG: hypothetical protein KC620_26110 [Myxococcales bacterium]|nr:hypothetical protein [Myxococcales bacterium]
MSMKDISLERWVALYDAFRGWRDRLTAHRHLSVFATEFDEVHAHGLAALRASHDKPAAAEAHERCRAADTVHDDCHRFAHGCLQLMADHGPPADRARVAQALHRLYPDGLNIVHAAWPDEVAATADFAARLDDPQLRADLAPALAEIPKLMAHLHACVTAGEALGEALVELDAVATSHEARSVAEAEAECREVWQLFLRALDVAARQDARAAALRIEAVTLFEAERRAAAR